MDIYNIYCDESCHLENDHQKVMVLGAIWCSLDKVKEISKRIREKKAAQCRRRFNKKKPPKEL